MVIGGSSDRLSDSSVRSTWREPKPVTPRSMMLLATERSVNRSSIASATNAEPLRWRSPR